MKFENAEDEKAYKDMSQLAILQAMETERLPSEIPKRIDFTKISSDDEVESSIFFQGDIEGATSSYFDEFNFDTSGTLQNEEILSLPPCSNAQAQHNKVVLDYILHLNNLARVVTAEAQAINVSSRSNFRLVAALDKYESERQDFLYFECMYKYREIVVALEENKRILAEGKPLILAALRTVFSSADKAQGDLTLRYYRVRDQRQLFENSPDGSGGLTSIREKHNEFLAALSNCKSFHLLSTIIGNTKFEAAPYYKAINDIEITEKSHSAETELDRLRDEYVRKFLRVPAPHKFSQTKRSRRFPFSELNISNDYNWAIFNDTLLNNLDLIADRMDAEGLRIQLNSVFRNPFRSVKLSRHQFGRAADWQVFDFDGSGGVREAVDWQILADLIATFSPIYLEPLADSGPGHVHAHW